MKLLPLLPNSKYLEKKWWHRLTKIVVIFLNLLPIFLIVFILLLIPYYYIECKNEINQRDSIRRQIIKQKKYSGCLEYEFKAIMMDMDEAQYIVLYSIGIFYLAPYITYFIALNSVSYIVKGEAQYWKKGLK